MVEGPGVDPHPFAAEGLQVADPVDHPTQCVPDLHGHLDVDAVGGVAPREGSPDAGVHVQTLQLLVDAAERHAQGLLAAGLDLGAGPEARAPAGGQAAAGGEAR